MKIIILFLLFVSICFSQATQEEKDVFFFTSKSLDAARDSISILKKINANLEAQNTRKDSIIRKDSVLLMVCNEGKTILMQELADVQVQEKPFIEFRGFFPGWSPSIGFDSNIFRNNIWSNLKHDITGMFKFSIKNKVDISAGVCIPLRREPIYLKANLEWRVF
jgi:hypothetical protein